jgi:hypothetical protein
MPIRGVQLKKKFIRFHHNSRPPTGWFFYACGMLEQRNFSNYFSFCLTLFLVFTKVHPSQQ